MLNQSYVYAYVCIETKNVFEQQNNIEIVNDIQKYSTLKNIVQF